MISKELQIAFLFDQARMYREEEKSLHAMQLYRRVLALDPLSLRCYLDLSSVYTEMLSYSPAINLLERALTLLPGAEELIYTLGECYLRLTRYDEALTWFRKIEAKKIPYVHYNLGLALLGKKEYRAAAEQFHQTIELQPDFPRIHGLLGEVYLKMNDPLAAIRHLLRETRRDLYHSANHHFLGLAYAALGNWEHAYEELTLAVDTDPDPPENWRLCGEALYHLKRFTEAEHYVRKALEISPASEESLGLLRRIQAVNGPFAHATSSPATPAPRDARGEHVRGESSSEHFQHGTVH